MKTLNFKMIRDFTQGCWNNIRRWLYCFFNHDHKWYNPNFHHIKDDFEYKIDKALSYLTYICYLRKENRIEKKDFCILQYEINRACISPAVQNYLWNLYHFSNNQNTICSFQYLIDYGIELQIINKNTFMDPNSNDYNHILVD